jgi:hypothetical protein
MKKIEFSIDIMATKEKVWDMLWSDAGYRKWTSAFTEGSYAESNWQEGSKIRFLSPGGDGMFAIIESKKDFEEMIFKHLGEIKNGMEVPKDWAGAKEAYYLKEENGITQLRVSLDTVEDYENYFTEAFQKALQILKQNSEQ